MRYCIDEAAVAPGRDGPSARRHNKTHAQVVLGIGDPLVTASGTGHSIVDKVLARNKVERRVVLRVPSSLGVARIVTQTEILLIVPRQLGDALAQPERVKVLAPRLPLPTYKVKQHWHERFNADAGNRWLRQSIGALFSDLAVKV